MQTTTAFSTIVLDTVVNNQGDAYSSTSGVFTAPFNGFYCFMATTETGAAHINADVFLMVDNSAVDYVYMPRESIYSPGSVHAVVHLRRGQRVSLKSTGDNYYWGRGTAFSGFLVSAADP